MNRTIVFGTGGCGCTVLNTINKSTGYENLVAVDSDTVSIERTTVKDKIQLAEEQVDKELITGWVKDYSNVVVVFGAAGKYGSNVGKRILQVSKAFGKQVEAVLVLPFSFEGKEKNDHAERVLEDLKAEGCKVYSAHSDNSLSFMCSGVGMSAAMGKLNEEIADYIQNEYLSER